MKNKKFNNIKLMLFLCIVVVLCLVITIFTGYRRVMSEAKGLASSIQEGAGMAITSVRQTAVRNGVMEWCLDAVSAEYINAEERAVFTGPSVTFFMEGRGNIKVTAEKGMVLTDSNNISVSGDVVVKDNDYVMKTQALNYDNGVRVFSSNVPVALSGTDFDLRADSASLDLKTQQAVLKGNVRGILSEDIEL